MFGLDLSTILGVMLVLIIACLCGFAFLVYKLGKASPAAAGTWQARAQAGIAGCDIHQVDDVWKMTPAYADLQTLKQLLGTVLIHVQADAKQAGAAVQTAVGNLAKQVTVDGGPTADPVLAGLQAQINARVQSIARQIAPATAAPTTNVGEGVEAFAARLGLDAASMRLLSKLHPGDTWEQLADRLSNPAKYFTDSDRDTVAAVTPFISQPTT